MNCPCGSGNSYEDCCQPFHTGAQIPETAEQLMRSRYSAYALAGTQVEKVVDYVDYLMITHDPKTRVDTPHERLVMKDWVKAIEYTGLEVLDTFAGQRGDKKGKVEFKAHFKTRNGPRKSVQTLHEKSRFRRFKSRWVYTDGEIFAST